MEFRSGIETYPKVWVVDLENDLGFSLYTTLSTCYLVPTSDKKNKV